MKGCRVCLATDIGGTESKRSQTNLSEYRSEHECVLFRWENFAADLLNAIDQIRYHRSPKIVPVTAVWISTGDAMKLKDKKTFYLSVL